MCFEHHKGYDKFRFSIHPDTHKIYSFHPAVSCLHDKPVQSPWEPVHKDLVPPHPTMLCAHFIDDDDDDDDDELAEVEGFDDTMVRVRRWNDQQGRSTVLQSIGVC